MFSRNSWLGLGSVYQATRVENRNARLCEDDDGIALLKLQARERHEIVSGLRADTQVGHRNILMQRTRVQT